MTFSAGAHILSLVAGVACSLTHGIRTADRGQPIGTPARAGSAARLTHSLANSFRQHREIEMAKRQETVDKVIDGDTFVTKTRKRYVRLANVHAPEANTQKGKEATGHLKELIYGKKVTVQALAIDIYGRVVASVKIDGKSINAAMNRKLGRV